MPYSVPTPPPSSLSQSAPTSPDSSLPQLTAHSQGRPGHRRSYSTQSHTTTTTYNFTDERGPGAFSSLGSLPRRARPPTLVPANGRATSATAKRFHFRGGENDPSSSEASDDDDEHLGNTLPPLKLKAKPGSPASFGLKLNTGNVVPFPRSSPLSSPLPGSPLKVPIPPLPTNDSGLLSPLSPGSSIANLPTLAGIDTRNPIYSPGHLAPPRPTPSRTSSSPVILLSNGKPLKSSLKSSSSTSSIPHQHTQQQQQQSYHTRARSAPSTPGTDLLASPTTSSSPSPSSTPITPKNVHFPSLSSDLERVRVFNRSAKPASLLVPRNGDETETETETEQGQQVLGAGMWGGSALWGAAANSNRWGGGGVMTGYPFPKVVTPPQTSEGAGEGEWKYEIDTAGHPLPRVELGKLPGPSTNVHVLLERFELVDEKQEGGLSLKGSVVVRNLAYEKGVWVRFTLDEWSTVSEVRAGWAESLEIKGGAKTVGDIVATSTLLASTTTTSTTTDPSESNWDRFTFSIKLEDYRARLEGRVVWLVGRYSVPGGEWWDNCAGKNWRVGFRRVWVPKVKVPATMVMKDDVKSGEEKAEEERIERVPPMRRGVSLSAPAATLSQPPPEIIAATVAAAKAGFLPVPGTTTSAVSLPDLAVNSNASSTLSTPFTPPILSTPSTPSSYSSGANTPPPPPDRKHVDAVASATEKRLRRLSLSNYVAPGGSKGVTSVVVVKAETEERENSVVFPSREGVDATSESTTTPASASASTPATEQGRERERKQEMVSPDPPKKRGGPLSFGFGEVGGLYWPWGAKSQQSQEREDGLAVKVEKEEEEEEKKDKDEDEDEDRTPPAVSTSGSSVTLTGLNALSGRLTPLPASALPASATVEIVSSVPVPGVEDVPMLERSGSVSSASSSSVDSLFLGGGAHATPQQLPHSHPQQRQQVGGENNGEGEFGFGDLDLDLEEVKTPVPGAGFRFSWGEAAQDGEGEGSSVSASPVSEDSFGEPPSHSQLQSYPDGAATGREVSSSESSLASLGRLSPRLTAEIIKSEERNGSAGGIDSDSLYKAFVRQWCFAESGPPGPSGTRGVTSPTSPASPVSPMSPTSPSSSVRSGKKGRREHQHHGRDREHHGKEHRGGEREREEEYGYGYGYGYGGGSLGLEVGG